MYWLTTLRALWAKLTGPKTATIEVQKLPALAPGDMLVCFMSPEWTPTVEDRERWIDGLQKTVGSDVKLVVLPAGVRVAVLQASHTVNNSFTVGDVASREAVARAVQASES